MQFQGHGLFCFKFFKGTVELSFWAMWFISLALDLNFKVLPLSYRSILWASLWGCLPTFFAVVHQDFTFFGRISGYVQHERFTHGRRIAWMVCVFSLAPFDVALLGVGCLVVSSSLVGTNMDSMVVIWPILFFLRRCYPFVNLFHNFHVFEHLVGLPVVLGFKVPSL